MFHSNIDLGNRALHVLDLQNRSILTQAIAAVDNALWDALGKLYNVPLYKLLGGYRDKVPVIAIGGYYAGEAAAIPSRRRSTPTRSSALAGIKFKVGRVSVAEDVRRVEHARKVAGDDFIIACDANQAWTPPAGDRVLPGRRRLNIRWIEEPVRWYDQLEGLRMVRENAPIPVTAGQGEISRFGVRDLVLARQGEHPERGRDHRRRRDRVAAHGGAGVALSRRDGAPRGVAGLAAPARLHPARAVRRDLPEPEARPAVVRAAGRAPGHPGRLHAPARRARAWAWRSTRKSSPGIGRTRLEGGKMKRVGFLLKVKQEMIPEYVKHHEAVWPEMLDALRRTGWHNYSIFMRPDGLLFGYFETPDSFQAALDGMSQEEINAKWQDFMAPYFEGIGGHADENMVELTERSSTWIRLQRREAGVFRRYERKSQPLLPPRQFARLLRHFVVAASMLAGALLIGVLGYRYMVGLGWLDSLLNASMILGGMGPVDPIRTPAGKLFVSFYVLFSGVVFITTAGLLIAPVVHRVMHRLHLEEGQSDEY